METTGYTTLTRQSGLQNEMRVIANNIANMATTGYRQEGVLFTEYVKSAGQGESVSMATARIAHSSPAQGAMTETGGRFDLAIEGAGYFQVDTPDGPRLTRAGRFAPDLAGLLVTPMGHPLLDVGGAPVFVPPDAADLTIASDGTLSSDGRPIGQIGLMAPPQEAFMTREDGVYFSVDGPLDPVENPRMVQGFLEGSNVDAMGEMARMIEVQRAYEMGQSFLESEHERVRSALATLIE